jgi:hypothetical protein
LGFQGVGDAPEAGDAVLYEVEIPIRR